MLAVVLLKGWRLGFSVDVDSHGVRKPIGVQANLSQQRFGLIFTANVEEVCAPDPVKHYGSVSYRSLLRSMSSSAARHRYLV